jgi:hypothetical protein
MNIEETIKETIKETIQKNNYLSKKAAILKWRELHRETYLYKQHLYNLKQYADPVKKEKKIKQIKAYQKLKREQRKEQQEQGQQEQKIKKKVGRPSIWGADKTLIITTN